MEDLQPQPNAPGSFLHTSRSFSPLFTTRFELQAGGYPGSMYRLLDCPDFGVIFPLPLSPLPYRDLKLLKSLSLSQSSIDDLTAFHFEMWSDLLKHSKEHTKVYSEAIYFVVPLTTADDIDWDIVRVAIGRTARKKLTEVEANSLPGSIWQATIKNKATWILVDAFLCCKVTIRQFLSCLLGRKHAKLEELVDKYKYYSVSDLILEETFDISSLKEFRGLISGNLAKDCDFFRPFVFVKPTKSIIQDGESRSTESQNFPNGTPLSHFDLLEKFYLTRAQWEMARKLPETLIRLENASLVLEFAQKYGEADFYDLREALTTTQLDIHSNFENLENMGDTVLKMLTTLHFYCKHPNYQENKLTSVRTNHINNEYLKTVSKSNNVYRFIRTILIKPSKWRPPVYDAKMGPTESSVQNYINEKAMADVVEALIGAYYMKGGTLTSVDFLRKIKLLKRSEDWEACLKYLSASTLQFVTQREINDYDKTENTPIGEILAHTDTVYQCGDRECDLAECEAAIGYTFTEKSLLTEALTQRSVNGEQNYERLEFLGDAVIDIAVVSNTFPFLRADTSPRELTNIKHILVNNQTLSRLTIAAGVYRYCSFTEELRQKVDEYLYRITWGDNPLQFGIYEDEPPKQLNDVFEALIGAILVDSKSLTTAAEITLMHMRPVLIHLVKNHKFVQKNIVNRMIEVGQKRGVRVKIHSETCGEASFAFVVNGEDQVISQFVAETLEVAKHQAALMAIEELEKLPVKD